MPNVKCCVVGDGAVGKTCLLFVYAKNEFPEKYVPTIFDNFNTDVAVDGNSYVLSLWDTAGQEWAPEVKHHVSGCPLVLVGTKIDIKDDDDYMEDLKRGGSTAIGLHEAQDLKKAIGAEKYMECSAKTGEGVKELFEEAVRMSLYAKKNRGGSTDVGKICTLL
eukprot:gene4500-7880_t